MNAEVAEAVEFALSYTLNSDDGGKSYLEWDAGIKSRAVNLETNSTERLRTFDAVPGIESANGEQATELSPLVDHVPDSLVTVANDAWRLIGGAEELGRALRIVAAARMEYTRAMFGRLLWASAACSLGIGSDRSISGKEIADNARKALESLNWSDSLSIANMPMPKLWAHESAIREFYDWLNHTTGDNFALAYQARRPACDISPKSEVSEMMAGLALSMVDAAAATPQLALALVSEAVGAMEMSGFDRGWYGHEAFIHEEVTAELRSFAQRGAYARHATHRARKEQAIAAYRAKTWPSKDAAALEIAKSVHLSFRVVRDYLKGI